MVRMDHGCCHADTLSGTIISRRADECGKTIDILGQPGYATLLDKYCDIYFLETGQELRDLRLNRIKYYMLHDVRNIDDAIPQSCTARSLQFSRPARAIVDRGEYRLSLVEGISENPKEYVALPLRREHAGGDFTTRSAGRTPVQYIYIFDDR